MDARLLEPARQIHQVARGEDVLQPGDVIVGAVLARVLPQIPDRTRSGDGAAQGQVLSAEHLQQAGLPGAVAADDAHLVAGAQREAEVADYRLAADLHGQVSNVERGHRRVLLKVVEPERAGLQVAMSIWWTSWVG